MNSRLTRRLIADHAALHTQPLPPNYLFPPGDTQTDDLTHLDILLAGPSHTPFSAGVWLLHLNIPSGYPDLPPTAFFRTPVFHPNVEPHTGAVCVETLKRDWDNKLTLRDVLVTISCLLIQPNPDSALNAEAGALIQESYESFARRATLMTGIHAKIPAALVEQVREAQTRGHMDASDPLSDPPARRRRTIARVRAATTQRRQGVSPELASSRRDPPLPTSSHQRFVFHSGDDDVFHLPSRTPTTVPTKPLDEDNDDLDDGTTHDEHDRENDSQVIAPGPAATPKHHTPRRPPGPAVPLGDLTLDPDPDSSMEDVTTADAVQPEYPPSPRKSPAKQPGHGPIAASRPAEGSSAGAARSRGPALPSAFNLTPPNASDRPLAAGIIDSSGVDPSPSPRKLRLPLQSLAGSVWEYSGTGAVPTSDRNPMTSFAPMVLDDARSMEKRKCMEMDAELWEACGRDVKRWNRGDFDGQPFKMMAPRW